MENRLTASAILQLIEFGREQSGVEFKSGGPRTDRALFAGVVRAVLGLANTRDGGHLILGIAEADGAVRLDGLSASDQATWAFDPVADAIAEYADPHVSFDLYKVKIDSHVVVVLSVSEFSEVPVLCRKDLHLANNRLVLRRGALYSRPRRKPETTEIAGYADMRDLLDLATEKGVRRLLTRLDAAGGRIESAEKRFASELDSFKCPLQGRIESRGFWRLRIHPTEYRVRLDDPIALRDLMAQIVVQTRGWSTPYFEYSEVALGDGNVSGSVDFSTWVQCWRLTASGQLVIQQGIQDDWRDQDAIGQAAPGWAPGQELDIATTICLFVDAYELAARLVQSPLGGSGMKVTVEAFGLKDRRLRFRFPNRSGFFRAPVASLPNYAAATTHDADVLSGSTVAVASKQAARLFRRFGWDTDAGHVQKLAGEAGCLRSS